MVIYSIDLLMYYNYMLHSQNTTQHDAKNGVFFDTFISVLIIIYNVP